MQSKDEVARTLIARIAAAIVGHDAA
jgi:hypothetical protein